MSIASRQHEHEIEKAHEAMVMCVNPDCISAFSLRGTLSGAMMYVCPICQEEYGYGK